MSPNKVIRTATTLVLGLALVSAIPACRQRPAPEPGRAGEAAGDPGWPREFSRGDKTVVVHQPQVLGWERHAEIRFLCAVAVTPGAGRPERYGVAEVTAGTVVDNGARTVVTGGHRRELRFPDLPEAEAAEMRRVVDEVLPVRQSMTVSLDRVLAYLEPGPGTAPPAVAVNLQPPPIFYSPKPAILVMFLGAPQFKPVSTGAPSLLFAVNTNWDVFHDADGGRYYLLDGEGWLAAADLERGPWAPTSDLPATLRALPADDSWADVRGRIPGKASQRAPEVFVATQPAEMIVTDGEPAFLPVPDTQLFMVSNTDSTLFQHQGDGRYYLLVAGRWFRAGALDGPWTAASDDLPADFQAIPDDGPAAYVRASVPGTPEAQDAVLLASIPKRNAVRKDSPPELQVAYDGEPEFAGIQGTEVQAAVNTSHQVFLAAGAYFCCFDGAWYAAASPTGPWTPATGIPPGIYAIPPSDPNYNVTYVTIEEVTPETVYYGETSGYYGEYVAPTGVLMYGMGVVVGAAAWGHYGYHYPPPAYYSWGCGAVYHSYYGGYTGYAHTAYGPHGGAGYGAAYDPRTGTYSRGAYAYGPAGSASARQAYNPATGAHARGGQVDTAQGSAGRFHAGRDGNSVSGGYRTGPGGSAAAVGWDTSRGEGAVVKTRTGDVYAGRDGNVYKREGDGQWSKYENGDWNTDRPAGAMPFDGASKGPALGGGVFMSGEGAATGGKRAGSGPPGGGSFSGGGGSGTVSLGEAARAGTVAPDGSSRRGSGTVSHSGAGVAYNDPGFVASQAEASRMIAGATLKEGYSASVGQSLNRDAQARSRGNRNASRRDAASRPGGSGNFGGSGKSAGAGISSRPGAATRPAAPARPSGGGGGGRGGGGRR